MAVSHSAGPQVPRVFAQTLTKFTPKPVPMPVSAAISKLLQLDALDRMYASLRARELSRHEFPKHVLSMLAITPVISAPDEARIPKSGPALLAANHPFGFIEGAVLAMLLSSVRTDVKILANSLLGDFEELRDLLILVNPFGGAEAARQNRKGMREALEWLEKGHLLAVFPAGEVSSFNPRKGGVTDPEWSPTVARLVRRSEATAIPAYFAGTNSALFHFAGMIHPRLRTALLAHEMLNKRSRQIELRVGNPVPARKLASFASDEELTAHLRERSYWLAERGAKKPIKFPVWKPKRRQAIADPADKSWLADELAALPPEKFLLEAGDLQVFGASGHEIPMMLLEIGRERERTFRLVGEGVGRPRDLDRFDEWYQHIVVWNKTERTIVGAYRLCGTDDARGGLYTETLFRFEPEFFRRISPALELGRSFVVPERQRCFQPLLLLWKGIGAYIVRNPRYRHLFGPVSISNEYQTASRDLMAAYLRCAAMDQQLARLVQARRPFHSTPHRHLLHTRDIDEIESAIQDVEPDAKGIPVLVRQYLRMGGRIAALHVDAGFGCTLDGLVVMDLLRAEKKALERYMGSRGMASFLAMQGGTLSAV